MRFSNIDISKATVNVHNPSSTIAFLEQIIDNLLSLLTQTLIIPFVVIHLQ